MKDDWKEDAEVLAAGASCPAPECGEINFTYSHGQPGSVERVESI